MRAIVFINLLFVVLVSSKTIDVKTAKELLQALLDVTPGDTIHLEDGNYHNKFLAEKSGTSGSPITITGSKNAVISGYNYGFWLRANYWVLKGFSITESNKGIVVENGNHNILENLTVHDIQEEGIHFRYNSADNILRHSQIYKTGLGSPAFGEGVYIGSAVSFCY
jgi:parallel beta-helix repeat protein